jgi:hypothetical protein
LLETPAFTKSLQTSEQGCHGITAVNISRQSMSIKKLIILLIYVIQYLICAGFAMFSDKVLPNPCNKVVFEGAFDQLMENIGGQEFMNVCSWELMGEWLLMMCGK